MNLMIHINPRSIYIGHIGEMHYISTVAALSERSSNVNSSKSNTNNCKRKCNDEMVKPKQRIVRKYS